jgi:O-antigen/teichoic acid export membrane protein
VQSLGLQAFGILSGSGAASWFLIRGSFSFAAIAFAAGPVAASLATVPFVSQLKLSWRPTTRGLKHLLGYSGAVASTLGFSALVLFALRWAYRDHFGAVELGYWLAANRISDLSTQFLGLFLLQAFVPRFTAATDPLQRRLLIVRYGAVGACLSGAALLIFLCAGRLLVHLFLSDAYLPAIPSIRLYMMGDFARLWVSLAMFTAFALGKPSRYAWIEISTMALMALMTLLLIRRGELLAPQIAYVSAFASMALLIGAAIFLRNRHWPREQLRRHGGRRTRLPGSVLRLP